MSKLTDLIFDKEDEDAKFSLIQIIDAWFEWEVNKVHNSDEDKNEPCILFFKVQKDQLRNIKRKNNPRRIKSTNTNLKNSPNDQLSDQNKELVLKT